MSGIDSGVIVSGRVYTVVEVGGRSPQGIEDFEGTSEFVLAGDRESHLIQGVGAVNADGARFHQKDPQHHGKDVRVWSIREAPDGGFVAQHDAAI